MDWGPEALLDTIELLRGKGIQTIGAGRNLAEARRAGDSSNATGLRVALLAYCSVLHEGYAAGPDKPGVAPMRAHPTTSRSTISRACRRGSSRRPTSRISRP